MFNKCKKSGGFTLVEMLVAMAIFSLAMVVVSQSFYFSIKAKKVLTAHSQMINEMSYNLERIGRGIRMAKKSNGTDLAGCLAGPNMNFEITNHTDCDGGSTNGIRFIAPNLTTTPTSYDCVEYYMDCPAGYDGREALVESRRNMTDPGNNFTAPLTSPAIHAIKFSIFKADAIQGYGWSQNDTLQPRVTLYLEVKDKENETMRVQTTISQRNPDVIK